MNNEFIISRITSHPDITNIFWMQICDLKNTVVIDDENKEQLLKVVLEVMKKIESVNYHRLNLQRIIGEQLEARKSIDEASADRTTGAENEFEAFLLQGKATLDVLVKVLDPLVNIKLSTYGDNGKRVLRSLQNNLPKDELKRANWLIRMIEVSQPWLEQWIGPYRDTIAHYKSMESTGFVSLPNETGKMEHHPPRDKSGIPLHELANNLFADLVTFCEDFLVFSYRIKMFKGFEVGYTDQSKRTKENPSRYGFYMIDYTDE